MHSTLTKLVGVGATCVATAALAFGAPAHADRIGVKDPVDTRHGSDLRAAEIIHDKRDVVVILSHTNLRRDPRTGSGGSVYVDTDPAVDGPEYVFVGGYFEGTDYQLLQTRGFGSSRWGKAVKGSYELTVDYAKDRVRMRMARAALRNPHAIRVAVRVAGTRHDGSSRGLVDWLGQPREFSNWVAQD